jgi:hypothetical protein
VAWSIFREGGGPGAAVTWARDLLKLIGAPQSLGNQQMVFDWETSEGGGGKFNPLNQGPVPGHPELTTTGSQYGGGAADFASWQAGLTGASDYLHMPAYAGILGALQANNPAGARAALIASPWAASHYGDHLSDAPLPGKASALPPGGGGVDTGGGAGLNLNPLDGFGIPAVLSQEVSGIVKTVAFVGPVVLAGVALIAAGVWKATSPAREKATEAAGDVAPLALAAV